jgi:hypothetical protein
VSELALDRQAAEALHTEGYVLLPGLVPRADCERALMRINTSLGSEGIARELLPTFRASTFTPELRGDPDLLGLFGQTPLAAMAEAALGPGNVRPPHEAQIALRFPGPGGPAVPHIDGIPYPGNGVPPGTLAHFTALAAVFLSPVEGPDRGNLTVWPGSHHVVAAHIREHGAAHLSEGFPDLPLGPPRAILAQPGDALLAHYALAHGIAPNQGPHIRYAVFFRLRHMAHGEHGERSLSDLWLEWPGVRQWTATESKK